MTEDKPIENRVAKSRTLTVDFEEILSQYNLVDLDIAPWLWQGLVLKEKDFRESLENHNWSDYAGKDVCVYCSEDAIIPTWAYMLVATYIEEAKAQAHFGKIDDVVSTILINHINNFDTEEFTDKRVIVKGCGRWELSPEVYMATTQKLQPLVKMLMFGEPCSTVPVYRKKRGN